jgi:fatty-acyl-CoA synthase
MMDTPLLISSIMEHADRNHGSRKIISVCADDPLLRYTYKDAFARTRQLANALAELGLAAGDRIATLAWNDHRHLELYYAVSCSGYVLHTINPRLYEEQLVYIINHAEDKVLFVDPMFVPLLEQIHDQVGELQKVVILTGQDHMPQSDKLELHCYEDLLLGQPDTFEWPDLDETDASAICYTSGTTGNPKGVVYNHRSTVIHSFAISMPDVAALSENDCVMPLVPMFHVNAWGIPYAAAMAGSKLVLPGPKMGDPESLHRLIETEQVTLSLGVPTVWLGLLAYLRETGKSLAALDRVIIGGAACPASVIKEMVHTHGVKVQHSWGMTEMSPVGTSNKLKAHMDSWDDELKDAQSLKQGRGVFGVEMKITDDNGDELPWDGTAFGSLKVRGPFICSSYFKVDHSDTHDTDGWFDTGDVATIDPDGYLQITDRTKDVIKSGGEWISSLELENHAMSHPDVAEAAVIGVAHEKWTERPLLLVVREPGKDPAKQELLDWYEGRVASWWIPDAVEYLDEIPHTATGKISKLELRRQFRDYQLEQ